MRSNKHKMLKRKVELFAFSGAQPTNLSGRQLAPHAIAAIAGTLRPSQHAAVCQHQPQQWYRLVMLGGVRSLPRPLR